jgi:hypothetical protein
MKLTEQEKPQLLDATKRAGSPRPPKTPLLSPAEYFARLEQFAQLLPRQKKPVAFTGGHWQL